MQKSITSTRALEYVQSGITYLIENVIECVLVVSVLLKI
jgi:hypothetical protein